MRPSHPKSHEDQFETAEPRGGADARLRQNLAKATPIFARSMHTELLRAGYTREEILRFVNKLLDLVHAEEAQRPTSHVGGSSPVVDPATGLPDLNTTRSMLAFSCRRANESARCVFTAMTIQIEAAQSSGATRHEARLALARILRETTRADDTIGHLDGDRYLVMAEGAHDAASRGLADRLATALAKDKTRSDSPWRNLAASLRASAFRRGDTTESILARVSEARPLMLLEPARSVFPQLRRVAQRRLVLALGGGAARSAAHIGLLRCLRERGVQIEGIAGTSGGALVGAMWALGLDEDEMIARFESFTTSPIFKAMRKLYASARRPRARTPSEHYLRKAGLAILSKEGEPIVSAELYREMIGLLLGPDRPISSLEIPFSATATDLVSGRAVELSHGSLHDALLASCAIPGLFPAQPRDGLLLVDGAVMSELPKSSSLPRAPEVPVLGVHLTPPKTKAHNLESVTELAARAAAVAHEEVLRRQLEACEHLLRIPVEEYGWLGFSRTRSLAEVGEAAARAYLWRGAGELGTVSARDSATEPIPAQDKMVL